MSVNIESARYQMVTQQVRAWSVLDPVILEVLSSVPREHFVPPRFRSMAFADTAIPLGDGQYMFMPQLEGRVLQTLEITSTDSVLEVGTGSGFLTACLGRLATRVTSLEIRPQLATDAQRRLAGLGIGNSYIETADVFQWHPAGTFDCILLGGSLPVFDPRFQDWLSPGGRLFMVVGEPPAMEACLIRRTGKAGEFSRESLFEILLPPLDHAPRSEPFSF